MLKISWVLSFTVNFHKAVERNWGKNPFSVASEKCLLGIKCGEEQIVQGIKTFWCKVCVSLFIMILLKLIELLTFENFQAMKSTSRSLG